MIMFCAPSHPSFLQTLTTASGARYFVKTSQSRDSTMFATEAAGLNALADAAGTGGLLVPRVLHTGDAGRGSFIVMEHLDLGGGGGGGGARLTQEALGVGLAKMHLAPPSADRARGGAFGFEADNWIGGTPQPNGWCESWVDFYRRQRLNYMLKLINRPGSPVARMGATLAANLDSLFEGVDVTPSLIHGDLWSGNMARAVRGSDGTAAWAILDPAAYYGHAEAEFGMSWCASFGADFWRGYRSLIPEAPGFARRRQLYELYHILNHEVLFSGYLGQAEGLLTSLTRGM